MNLVKLLKYNFYTQPVYGLIILQTLSIFLCFYMYSRANELIFFRLQYLQGTVFNKARVDETNYALSAITDIADNAQNLLILPIILYTFVILHKKIIIWRK